MTVRAVLLGCAGVCLICSFTYFNDHVIRQTYLVGSHMPTAVYGGLILAVLLVNPALRYFKRRWQLTGAELAVAAALTLAACCIPSAGLLETFPDLAMMPHHYVRTFPAWQSEGVVEMAPRSMLADVSQDDDRALNGYVQGLSTGTESISWSDVPWSAWTRTLAFWLPVLLLLWVGLVGLSVVLHRQWSDHERLPYPIATVVESLLPTDGESRRPAYLERLFWVGCGAVCFIHLCNYVAAWWPDTFIPLPLRFSFHSLGELFPTLQRAHGTWLLRVDIYFTIIGIAYFLPKDVSFSMGIGPFLYYYLAGVLAGFGVSMAGGGAYAVNLMGSLQVGAYAGMFLVIVYTGRRYYGSVFRSALGLRTADAVEPHAVWGARAFLACGLVIVAVLSAVGLDWQLSLLYTVLLVMMFVVIGRISAETGHIFIQMYAPPALVIMGLMGTRAIGPSAALVMFLLSAALIVDTREALPPFVLNAFRVLSERGVRLSGVAGLSVLALALGLAVAVPVTLYVKYDRGTDLRYGWASRSVPQRPFDGAIRIRQRLRTQGELEDAESRSGWRRFLAVSPSSTFLVGFTAALAAFLLLTMARLRFPSWPLHPALLLIWCTWGGRKFCSAFLVGCLLKWAIVKYGGDKAFQRLKPLMIGLIAADMLTGFTTSLIGGVYYFATGQTPPRFVILVG